MKKAILLVISAILVLSLCACGKRCENCGKTSNDGYEFFGNYYCEDCLF